MKVIWNGKRRRVSEYVAVQLCGAHKRSRQCKTVDSRKQGGGNDSDGEMCVYVCVTRNVGGAHVFVVRERKRDQHSHVFCVNVGI